MLYNKNKTFTGTDTLVFIIFPNTKPILLGSLTTLSYSLYRHKTPVPLLGRISTGGCTRGTRVVAGTMIFTLINQHWVNELANKVGYISQYNKIKADELPIFDLMIVSANEFGSSASAFIYGVDFTEEAGVVSIEDLMMENTFKFVARDIDMFYENDFNQVENKRFANVNSIIGYREMEVAKEIYVEPKNVQLALIEKGFNVKVTGTYDTQTMEAVRTMQRKAGLLQTGAIDSFTRNYLFENNKAPIINKNKEDVNVKDEYGNTIDYIKYGDSVSNYIENENKLIVHDGYIESNELIEENFAVSSNMQEGSLKISYIEMIKGILKFKIRSDLPVEVKLTGISIFDDGDISVTKKSFNCLDLLSINSSSISEAFIYNVKNKSLPKKVEVILSIGNKKHLKFIISNIRG